MLSHNQIWEALDRLAERHELTPSGLARARRPRPDLLQQIETAFRRWAAALALDGIDRQGARRHGREHGAVYGFHAAGRRLSKQPAGQQENAFPPQGGSIPLLGFAQAGAGGFFDDGGFPAGQGWDVVDFPAAPSQKAGVYALEVQGESMMPLYRDGDVLIVEPGAQVRRNDRVVVRTNEGEVMAKVLLRQSPRSIELLSLNPEHPNRTLELSDVDWIARIIWASQ